MSRLDDIDYDPAEDEYAPTVCPVTGMYCSNELDPSCEESGCALKAGLPRSEHIWDILGEWT